MIQLFFFSTIFLASYFHSSEIEVSVQNTTDFNRTGEVIEIEYNAIADKLALKNNEQIIVLDENGVQLPSQITHDGLLLFPATVIENGVSKYFIKKGVPEKFSILAFGRFVPERHDDYAWENNRIAFRLYGPSLKAIDGASNGVDVWSKRTESMIVDLWYERNANGENYHTDRGEGADVYKVGATLGGGMAAPLLKDKLQIGENFIRSETLDNGPLRTKVKLTYAPSKINGNDVVEYRVITLDANSSFNKMEVTYSGLNNKTSVAAGLTLHSGAGVKMVLPEDGATYYWEKQAGDFGTIGTALVFKKKNLIRTEEIENHLCLIGEYHANKPFTYYFGACWDRYIFTSQALWQEEVSMQSARIENPLIINVGI